MMDAEKIEISSFAITIECPYCNKSLNGWIGDPRGAEDVECEDCGQKFNVPKDCEIVLF